MEARVIKIRVMMLVKIAAGRIAKDVFLTSNLECSNEEVKVP